MIEFEVPGPDAPGYLKRQRKLAAFMEGDGNSVGRWEAMVEYLLDFVTKPVDRDEARDALWEMSEADYQAMLEKIAGQGDVPKNK